LFHTAFIDLWGSLFVDHLSTVFKSNSVATPPLRCSNKMMAVSIPSSTHHAFTASQWANPSSPPRRHTPNYSRQFVQPRPTITFQTGPFYSNESFAPSSRYTPAGRTSPDRVSQSSGSRYDSSSSPSPRSASSNDDLPTDSYMDHHLKANSGDPDNMCDFILLPGTVNARRGMKTAAPESMPCKYGNSCFRTDCRYSHASDLYTGPASNSKPGAPVSPPRAPR